MKAKRTFFFVWIFLLTSSCSQSLQDQQTSANEYGAEQRGMKKQNCLAMGKDASG